MQIKPIREEVLERKWPHLSSQEKKEVSCQLTWWICSYSQTRIWGSGVRVRRVGKWKWKVKVTQSCLTLCDPMDYTVHGIFQARILECIAFPFSRGSSQPRDWTQVSCMAGGFFTSWATRRVCNSETICFKETLLGTVVKYFPRCSSGPIAGEDR